MKTIRIFAVFVVIAFAGCATSPLGGVAGTSAFTGPTVPASARLTLLAVDYSASTAKDRLQSLTTVFSIGTNLDPKRDNMRFFRFGHSIEEFYSHLPEDDDAFALLLTQQVKTSDPARGTDYPHALERLADTASEAQEAEIRIVILGDGENDYRWDPAHARRYRNAALRLSKNQKLKWVRFWGVKTGSREEIRNVFRPLGRKLQILSLDQNPLAP